MLHLGGGAEQHRTWGECSSQSRGDRYYSHILFLLLAIERLIELEEEEEEEGSSILLSRIHSSSLLHTHQFITRFPSCRT